MKTLIYFNLATKPENIGASQLVDDVNLFIENKKEYLPNTKIEGDRLTFDSINGRGYAMLFQVDSDFQN